MPVLINSNKTLDCPYKELNSELQEISLALKVLSCVVNKQKPSSEDVHHLRSLVPDMLDAPIDLMACAVVKKFTGRRLERSKPVL